MSITVYKTCPEGVFGGVDFREDEKNKKKRKEKKRGNGEGKLFGRHLIERGEGKNCGETQVFFP